MDRAGLIESLTTALTARPEVVEAKIDGSLGRDVGDAHSDIDFLVTVAEDGDVGVLNAALPDILRATCDPVLIRVFPFVITFVTREWVRGDVAVRAASWPPYAGPDPAAQAKQTVDELFRCFGLAPVVTARGEWESAVVGTGMMVGLLTELMQLENGTFRVGGAMRLRERLTPASPPDDRRGLGERCHHLRHSARCPRTRWARGHALSAPRRLVAGPPDEPSAAANEA